jgi:hypothetical protein
MKRPTPNKNILNNNSLKFKTAVLMYCMSFPAYYIVITSYGTLSTTKFCKTIAKTIWILIKKEYPNINIEYSKNTTNSNINY